MSTADKKWQFQKGKSGNPAGRPAGKRSMAKALVAEGEQSDVGELTNSKYLVRHIWQALVKGEVELVGGIKHKLSTKEWIELVRWAHQHVDGTVNYGVSAAEMEAERVSEADDDDREHTSASELARFRRLLLSQRNSYDNGRMSEENYRWLVNDLRRRGVYVNDLALPEKPAIAAHVEVERLNSGYDDEPDEDEVDPDYDHEKEYQRAVAEFEAEKAAKREAISEVDREEFFEQLRAGQVEYGRAGTTKTAEDTEEVKIFPSPDYVATLQAMGEGEEYGERRRIW